MTRLVRNPERSFGTSVGGLLCVIAGVLFWKSRTTPAGVLAAVGFLLLTLGLTRPQLLAWPSRLWWRFAHALGYVNARIILTVLFALFVVPLGFILRLTGRDPLARRRDRWSGWSPYPERLRDRRHYSRMY